MSITRRIWSNTWPVLLSLLLVTATAAAFMSGAHTARPGISIQLVHSSQTQEER